MFYTFLAAQGVSVGNSLCEESMIETCKDLLDRYADVIHIPQDVVVADSFSADAESKIVPFDKIPDGWMGLDIGPESVKRFAAILTGAKTVFWNGPMGVFEFPKFEAGTRGVARQSWRQPRRAPSASSAAATPQQPFVSSVSRTRASRTFPPVVALPSSTSRAKSCLASQYWKADPTWHVSR